jgi:2'-hydroxyisoflavone reductase
VLAPGAPENPLQWIDVRDLAAWLVTLAERGTAGAFTAVGPASPGRWGDVLDACVKETPGARLVWVPADWLEKNGAGEEDAFPIWVPPTGKYAGFHQWKNERAEAAGLTFRPLAETLKGLLAWYPGEVERRVRVTRELTEAAKAGGPKPPPGDPAALRAGPPPERERELLARWAKAQAKAK